jgi:hypothetical protein
MANEQAFLRVWEGLTAYTKPERRECLLKAMDRGDRYWRELQARVRNGVATGLLSHQQSLLFDHILDARRSYQGSHTYIHTVYDDVIEAHITVLGEILNAERTGLMMLNLS